MYFYFQMFQYLEYNHLTLGMIEVKSVGLD